MELELFDQVADALRAMVPAELGDLRTQPRRWGIKAWFDAADCPREHYEAQVISAAHVAAAEVLAVEIGFHAEHPKAPLNDEVLRRLCAVEPQWRTSLGDEAVAGDFIGRAGWRRISEVWPTPESDDLDEAIEVAARLADYVHAIEPLRRIAE